MRHHVGQPEFNKSIPASSARPKEILGSENKQKLQGGGSASQTLSEILEYTHV